VDGSGNVNAVSTYQIGGSSVGRIRSQAANNLFLGFLGVGQVPEMMPLRRAVPA
jgi:hypothetical protein